MEKVSEVIQRIEKQYVGKDCVQLVFVQKGNAMTILDQDGIVYHKKEGSNLFVDKSENKRKQYAFPYSNISCYKDKKYEYVNQIIDFDKVYIRITGDNIIETYAIRDGKEALVLHKILHPIKEENKICTKEEVNEIFQNNKNNTYFLNGSKINIGNNFDLIDNVEKEVFNNYKNLVNNYWKLEDKILRYAGLSEDYCTECSDGILYNSEEIVEFIEKVFEKSMKKMTIDDMIFNPTLFDDIVFVHTDGGVIVDS